MPAVGKEIEHQISQEQYSQPTESVPYMEKVEKQVETQQKASSVPQQTTTDDLKKDMDMGHIVSAQFAIQEKSKIILPGTQEQIAKGRNEKPKMGVRWLYEWAVMMIKKYPERVFYLPPEKTQ